MLVSFGIEILNVRSVDDMQLKCARAEMPLYLRYVCSI